MENDVVTLEAFSAHFHNQIIPRFLRLRGYWFARMHKNNEKNFTVRQRKEKKFCFSLVEIALKLKALYQTSEH